MIAGRPDIAVVIGSMRIGGAERATLHLINGLSKKGLKVELVLLYKVGAFLDDVDPHINIVNLNKRKTSHALGAFRNYLKQNDPQMLFAVQNHIQLLVLMAVKLSSWKGKIILNEQSTFSKNLNGFKGTIQRNLSKLLFRHADRITCVSKGVASDLEKLMPSMKIKIQVIPNAIITDEFFKVNKKKVEHPFFDKGHQVIISAGRFIKSKNFDLLIQAFKIYKKDQNAKLIILGDGSERHHLKHLINSLHLKDDVSMPGFVPDPSMYFSRSDLFVLSSDYEGLPGVIIEALACGCKVVSTDCESGPAEILMNGKFGWLSHVGNAELLSEKMETAIKTTVNKELLIERANDFHEDKVVAKYLELFNTLQ